MTAPSQGGPDQISPACPAGSTPPALIAACLAKQALALVAVRLRPCLIAPILQSANGIITSFRRMNHSVQGGLYCAPRATAAQRKETHPIAGTMNAEFRLLPIVVSASIHSPPVASYARLRCANEKLYDSVADRTKPPLARLTFSDQALSVPSRKKGIVGYARYTSLGSWRGRQCGDKLYRIALRRTRGISSQPLE